jgi:phosphoribosylformylglycinamidine (FGAM) synthase-like enzyme
MGQFAAAILGIGEACRALDFPVVSGNVSLYNETDGVSIPPTPTIGGVGLLADAAVMTTLAFKNAGDAILLVGKPGSHLGRSAYLAELLGRDEGAPPSVDLKAEKAAGDFVRVQIAARKLTAVHDISDGGLAIALAEMAMAGSLGATIDMPSGVPRLGWLFGEDQARYVLTCAPGDAETIVTAAKSAGVPVSRIGSVGGDELICSAVFGIRLAKLKAAYENWFPAFMSRPV